MKITLSLLFIALFLFVSCMKPQGANNIEDFLKEQANSAAASDAIKIIEESKTINDAESTEIISTVLDDYGTEGDNDMSDIIMGDKKSSSALLEENVSKSTKLSTKTSTGVQSWEQMKKLTEAGKYKQASESKIDENSPMALFYKGIAYYAVAEQASSKTLRRSSVKEASAHFKEAGIKFNNKELKAKAILWHGITQYKFMSSSLGVATLLKPFEFIEKNLKNSRCYNDSIFYKGLVFKKKGETGKAINEFLRISNLDANDKIYDADYKKWVSPNSAIAHYQALLGNGKGVAKQTSEVTPTPTNDADLIEKFEKKVDATHREITSTSQTQKESVTTTKNESVVVKETTKVNTSDDGLALDVAPVVTTPTQTQTPVPAPTQTNVSKPSTPGAATTKDIGNEFDLEL